jgi:hypothetical protein
LPKVVEGFKGSAFNVAGNVCWCSGLAEIASSEDEFYFRKKLKSPSARSGEKCGRHFTVLFSQCHGAVNRDAVLLKAPTAFSSLSSASNSDLLFTVFPTGEISL